MSNNRRSGALGETLACEYLTALGYTILERNYTCPMGEVDVVATDGEYLFFVEVKARYGGNMGWPLEAVTPAKITQIVKVANWYLTVKRVQKSVRFDVACVDLAAEKVSYIPNAFTAADAGRKNHW